MLLSVEVMDRRRDVHRDVYLEILADRLQQRVQRGSLAGGHDIRANAQRRYLLRSTETGYRLISVFPMLVKCRLCADAVVIQREMEFRLMLSR